MQADLRIEHELLAIGSEHDVWCMLELAAPEAPVDRERRPLALALVIDRSGSMAGRKLAVTRASARFLAERLAPADRLAVVTYDDEIELRVPLAAVGTDRRGLCEAIERIHPGGSTNLSGGYLKGVEVLGAAPPDALRRVLLLSDGLANVGITAPDALRDFAARAREATGITTSTIGLGADFDEDLMTAMADAGGGNAHFAESPDDAPGIFGREFTDLVSVVAQNLSVEIRPEPPVASLDVLNDFPIVPVEGGVQAQLGDAYGGERRRVVFGLHVPDLTALGPRRIAEVVLRYVSVGERIAHHELRMPVVVNLVSADEAATAVPDATVREEVLILQAGRAGKRARELADAGDLEAAHLLLEDAARQLERAAPGSPRAQDLLEQAEFWGARSHLLASGAYDALERKRLTYRSRESGRGRKRRPEP
ncbi:MAG: hypothetical protein KatS3mg014_1061 [Actinomycetota bacterium]|nr:MAG: hypothetical protein KatS3mg014_1061 [Actinomycetota bacterium]